MKSIPICSVLFIISFVHLNSLVTGAQTTDDDDFNWDGDFGDFLNSVNSMADMLSDFVGDEDGSCGYSCKNGAATKPRKGHTPKSNGCGSFGLQLDTTSVPGVTECCDKHDYCYDTCNSNREKCDNDFKLCLDHVCDEYEKDHDQEVEVVDSCYSTSELMYTAAMTLGCKPYKDSQKEACTCDHDEL